MPKSSKRKADDEPSTALVAMDDEMVDDKPPLGAAMQALANKLAKKVPVVNISTSTAPGATLSAIVLSAKKVMGVGRGGATGKMEIVAAVSRCAQSQTKDMLSTGVDGVWFSMPTKVLEPSPDEVAANKDAKGTTVLDVTDDFMKTNTLGVIKTTFYLDAPVARGSGAPPPSIEACTPGMEIQISGVTSTYGRGEPGGRLFLNGRKSMPTGPPVEPGDAAIRIIEAASRPSAMAASALLVSMTHGGFFDKKVVAELGTAVLPQVEACKSRWTSLVAGTAAKLEATALAISDEDVGARLNGNAARVRQLAPKDVAEGVPLFGFDADKDNQLATPHIAAIVQQGCVPSNEPTGGFPKWAMALTSPAERDSVPDSFSLGMLQAVEFKGVSLATLQFRMLTVFDKAAAIAVIEADEPGASPFLIDDKSSVVIKASKRALGQEIVGSLNDEKVMLVCKEVLKHCDLVLHAPVYPRGWGEEAPNGFFPSSLSGINFSSGVARAGARVSLDFINKEMLDAGESSFDFEAVGTPLVPPEKSDAAPSLLTKAYQALSEANFKPAKLRTPPNKSELQYYVVYEGCSAAVAADPDVSALVDAGEDAVAAAAEKAAVPVKELLTKQAIVYAVAV